MQKQEVLDYFGGPLATAKALRITSQAVSKWGERIPQLRAYEIERLTQGQLKVSDCDKPTHEGQPT